MSFGRQEERNGKLVVRLSEPYSRLNFMILKGNNFQKLVLFPVLFPDFALATPVLDHFYSPRPNYVTAFHSNGFIGAYLPSNGQALNAINGSNGLGPDIQHSDLPAPKQSLHVQAVGLQYGGQIEARCTRTRPEAAIVSGSKFDFVAVCGRKIALRLS